MELQERRIPRVAIAGLALLVLFGLGSLLYNAGWSSGMATGLLAANSEGSAITPYLLARTGGLNGGVGFFGGLLRIGFFLFVLVMIGRFFGFARWKMHRKFSGSVENGGQHRFHPMWEAHRAWHEAQEAEKTEKATATPPVTPAETPDASQ